MSVRIYRASLQVTSAGGVTHRPMVSRSSAGGAVRHTLTCGCGHTGEVRTARALADQDLRDHLTEMSPVPPERRCQQPKAHGLQPWDECALCVDQLPLPGFETEESTR